MEEQSALECIATGGLSPFHVCVWLLDQIDLKCYTGQKWEIRVLGLPSYFIIS
jgi:hypothetical protein